MAQGEGGDLSLPRPAPTPTTGSVQEPHGTGLLKTYLHTSFEARPRRQIIVDLKATPEVLGPWTRLSEAQAPRYQLEGVLLTYVRQDPDRSHLGLSVSADGFRAEVTRVTTAPESPRDLTAAQANALEAEWLECLRPYLPGDLQIRQRGKRTLRDVVSPATRALLIGHSLNSGNTHSNDKERWLNFVAQAAREGLTDDDADCFLVQEALLEEGFTPEQAVKLTQDFARHIEMAMVLI